MVWDTCPASFFWMWLCSCLSTIYWKKYFFLIEMPCKNQLTINVWVYFWIVSFILFIYMYIRMLTPHSIVYYCFLVSFEITKWKFSNILFFSIFCELFLFSCISLQILDSACQFWQKNKNKNAIWGFDRDCASSIDQFWVLSHFFQPSSSHRLINYLNPLQCHDMGMKGDKLRGSKDNIQW